MKKQHSFTLLFSILIIYVLIINVPLINAQDNNNNNRTTSLLPNNGGCPFPLISLKMTGLSATKTSLCIDDCCLSCPVANNFYDRRQIDLIFNVLSVVRIISFIGVLILVLSYIVLPNKREHPAITVLCFNISLLIFTGVTFFYLGNIKRIQCADLITQATIKNNVLCGVQGIVVVFSTFLLILLCFVLILHLHFQTVWGSRIMQKYHLISQALVMVISLTFTVLPTVMGKISFDFGAVCLVSSEYMNSLFWYPLAFFAIPGFLIHCCTFISIGKSQFMNSGDYDDSTLVSIETEQPKVTGQEIVKAIKIQWRSLMLALILLITFIIYWTYASIEVYKLVKFYEKPWFATWLNCIFENGMNNVNAQNTCSIYANGNVPTIVHLTFAESATALLGMSIFIVFGTSIDLWSEWKYFFGRKFGTISDTWV